MLSGEQVPTEKVIESDTTIFLKVYKGILQYNKMNKQWLLMFLTLKESFFYFKYFNGQDSHYDLISD